jgi:hypothetical protein
VVNILFILPLVLIVAIAACETEKRSSETKSTGENATTGNPTSDKIGGQFHASIKLAEEQQHQAAKRAAETDQQLGEDE